MNKKGLLAASKCYMHELCTVIPERSVGSKGNCQATDFFAGELRKNGWQIEETMLEVMDWKSEGAILSCNRKAFDALPSPYSTGCSVDGELVAASTINELEALNSRDKIILLHGEIAKEQVMPKKFVFYNPEEHQKIISILERSGTKAIISATGRNPELAGGVYPFPMFEDGDFDIPSVYMKDTEGDKLLACVGGRITLESKAERIPQKAFNIKGIKESATHERIAVTAHIDSKKGTPGAIDNATGVTVLLLLSGLLRDYRDKYTIELVAFNGEDYYSAPGQMKYIEQNAGRFEEILLNINIDGAGYIKGITSFSAFRLPESIQKVFKDIIHKNPFIKEGPPWYQGDHSIFIQSGRPAIAVSSEWFIENMALQDITHTPRDNLSIVNHERIVEISLVLRDLINLLNN